MRLLDADDVRATSARARVAAASAHNLKLVFPTRWPHAFKTKPFKSLLSAKGLKGTRCRAVDLAPPQVGNDMLPLASFDNAERLAALRHGWHIVKGFAVFEWATATTEARDDDDDSEATYIALRHWWLEKSTGGWVDPTPIPGTTPERRVLVESALGDKEAAEPSAARKAFAAALAERIRAGGEPSKPAPEAATATSASALSEALDVATVEAPAAQKRSPAAADPLNYARWDQIDVSDDEEEEARSSQLKALAERRRAESTEAEALKAQQANVDAAVDAAIAASTHNNVDELERIDEAARASAPLADDMERLLDTLPPAAKLAARAAAAIAPGSAATAAAGEPTLRELLSGAQQSADASDPTLEEPSEFFDHVAAPSQTGTVLPKRRPSRVPAQSPAEQIEWLGDWS